MGTVNPQYILRVSDYIEGISDDSKKEAAAAVAAFVKERILLEVSKGNSPVDGYGAFDRLKKGYADREKGGNTTPNLDLTGDMLDGLTVESNDDGEVKIFIQGSFENDKASGHNQFSGGESKTLPIRRFIPEGEVGESFKSDIERGIKKIVQEMSRVDLTEKEMNTAEKSVKKLLLKEANKKVSADRMVSDILREFEDLF